MSTKTMSSTTWSVSRSLPLGERHTGLEPAKRQSMKPWRTRVPFVDYLERLETDPQPRTRTLRDLLECPRGGVSAPTLKPGNDRLRGLHALGELYLGQSGASPSLD